MPGTRGHGIVTMKSGVFRLDSEIGDWLNGVGVNSVERARISISLLDEAGNPTLAWTLSNAWPTKAVGTELRADGSEVAVECVEIAHEGLTLVKA